jgi:hypothetical protein
MENVRKVGGVDMIGLRNQVVSLRKRLWEFSDFTVGYLQVQIRIKVQVGCRFGAFKKEKEQRRMKNGSPIPLSYE